MKITRLPPAVPEGNITGPYPDRGAVLRSVHQRQEQDYALGESGIGGEAHCAYLSGPQEWAKYIEERLWWRPLVDALGENGEKETKDDKKEGADSSVTSLVADTPKPKM